MDVHVDVDVNAVRYPLSPPNESTWVYVSSLLSILSPFSLSPSVFLLLPHEDPMCSQRRSANSYGLHALLSIANRCTRHDTGSTIVPEKRNTRDTKVWDAG